MAALGTVKDTVREQAILKAFTEGDYPSFLKSWVDVTTAGKGPDGRSHTLVYRVAPDYLAVGTNEDYVLMPMYPGTAQKIADQWGCILPTYQMVKQIWRAAPNKLHPYPQDHVKFDNTANSSYLTINTKVQAERKALGRPLGTLTAGHKKDIILSKKIPGNPGRIFIYGWFSLAGNPIQGLPLYSGHSNHYVDYSHGVRLVNTQATLDGEPVDIREVLGNTPHGKRDVVCQLISEEGPLAATRYDGP